MAIGFQEEHFHILERVLKQLGGDFDSLRQLVGKLQQDAAQQRQQPADSSTGNWEGYTYGAIPPASGNAYGQATTATVDLVRPVAGNQPSVSLGLPRVSPLNGTGGQIPANVRCGGTVCFGLYIVHWANCKPGTYNGAPGDTPPSSGAALATQDEQQISSQDGQIMTAQ